MRYGIVLFTSDRGITTAASVTERIRLGTAVALPVEHDPISLAKTIATLDHVSEGRVPLGVGLNPKSSPTCTG